MQDQLQIQDICVGLGKEAQRRTNIKVHYTGRLEDGTKFDSSIDRGDPFEFVLGVGMVISGWDLGIGGDNQMNIPPMRVGGKRILKISANLGYGSEGVPGVIPPNATLIFEVELLA